MAGALPAAALPARPSSTPRSYGICISMGRAQPAHRLGLRSVLEGPPQMLLPNDTLVHEIICLRTKKKSQPREKLGKFRHAWAKYGGRSPMATLKNGGYLLLGAQQAACPVIPAPSPPAK